MRETLKIRDAKNMNQNDKNNDKIDLSGLLKDSSADMKFEEDRASRSYYSGTPKIIQWVIEYSGGLIKDEKRANYVLIGFVAVAIIVTFFLIFGGSKKFPESERPGIEIFKDVPPLPKMMLYKR